MWLQICRQRLHAEDATTALLEQGGGLGPDASLPHRHGGRRRSLDSRTPQHHAQPRGTPFSTILSCHTGCAGGLLRQRRDRSNDFVAAH
jgi:hypothetical protein